MKTKLKHVDELLKNEGETEQSRAQLIEKAKEKLNKANQTLEKVEELIDRCRNPTYKKTAKKHLAPLIEQQQAFEQRLYPTPCVAVNVSTFNFWSPLEALSDSAPVEPPILDNQKYA